MVTAVTHFTKESIPFLDLEQLYAIRVVVVVAKATSSIQTFTSTKLTESQENLTSEKKEKKTASRKGKLRQCGREAI